MMLSISRLYYQIILSHGIGFGLGMALQYVVLDLLLHNLSDHAGQILPSSTLCSATSRLNSDVLYSLLYHLTGF